MFAQLCHNSDQSTEAETAESYPLKFLQQWAHEEASCTISTAGGERSQRHAVAKGVLEMRLQHLYYNILVQPYM